MKRALFLVICIGVLFTSCRKKQPALYCWAVFAVDSVASPVDSLHQAAVQSGPFESCYWTVQGINAYLKTNSYIDTVSKSPLRVKVHVESAQVW